MLQKIVKLFVALKALPRLVHLLSKPIGLIAAGLFGKKLWDNYKNK